MFKVKLCQSLFALLLLAGAQAASLVVYPFTSDDPRVGTAVSWAVAHAFEGEHEVFGPVVAPTLVPPFHVDGGFYNPTAFHEDTDSLGVTAMLRGASGADVVVNGHMELVDGHLVLELQLAHPEGMSTLTVQAEAGDATTLVRRTVGITARLLGMDRIPEVAAIDLGGVDGSRAMAVHHAGLAGGLEAALQELQQPILQDDEFAGQLRQAIHSVLTDSDEGDPALLAALSLNTAGLDELRSARYFELLDEQTDLPAVKLWEAVLLASSGTEAAAGEAFRDAASYPYGLANLHAWQDAPDAVVAEALPAADSPALLTYSLLARSRGNLELEKRALHRLTRLDPWQVFAFERLSFIGFEEEEPLAAGQALAVAVTLEPGSDLYWTNLGWAQYLLGLLEQSEDSSIRATLLAPQQLVAHYNLGLVRTVTGRQQEAIGSYDTALRFDPVVNEDAIEDLQAALELYPKEPAVHYSLAYLLEAAGRRSLAARHYGSYLRRVQDGGFADRARARVLMLEAPAPELQLPGGIRLFLGGQPLTDQQVQAGDPLRPSFEVYTPGEVLPTVMQLEFSLLDHHGSPVFAESHQLTLPTDTVGFMVDGFTLTLPADMAPGNYRLLVTVSASEDRQVSSEVTLQVVEQADPLRALLGFGIVLQSIESGAPLFDRNDLGDWPQALAVLQRELAAAAPAAEEVLPVIEQGRFQGMSGGEAFAATSEDDLRDFLSWFAHPELAGSAFVFVDTYAQWILDGTPTD